jgi:hypothetical protein
MSTLEELEGDVWAEPEWQSGLVVGCHQLRKKPIEQFTISDHTRMIGQKYGLSHLLPIAIGILENDPLAEGDHYPGELLQSVLLAPNEYFLSNSLDASRVTQIVFSALSELEMNWKAVSKDITNELRACIASFLKRVGHMTMNQELRELADLLEVPDYGVNLRHWRLENFADPKLAIKLAMRTDKIDFFQEETQAVFLRNICECFNFRPREISESDGAKANREHRILAMMAKLTTLTEHCNAIYSFGCQGIGSVYWEFSFVVVAPGTCHVFVGETED